MSGLGCIVFNGMIAFLGIAALCVLFAVGLAISGNAAALTDRGLATVIFAATGAFSSFVGLFTACCRKRMATIILFSLCCLSCVIVMGLVGDGYIVTGVGYYLVMPGAGALFGFLAALFARNMEEGINA